MAFEKIIMPSEKDLIIDQLERKIVSGELPIDSKLPTERELSEQMGVTKTVMHFALKELEQLKFLRCVPRHGTYVNDWMHGGNMETLNAVLKLQGVNVNPVLKDSLIRLRNNIESDAMALCSHTCSESDYAQMQRAIDDLKQAPENSNSEVFARLIFKFHYLIIEKSGNLMYPILLNAFEDFSILIWIRCVEFWTRDKILEFEQMQLDMIKAGKGVEAGEHMKKMYSDFLENHELS